MSLIMVCCFSSALHGVLSSSCVLKFGCLVHCISWYNTCAKTFSCSYLQKNYNLLALSLIMFYWALRAFSTLSAIEFRHHAICASVRFSLKYLTWLLLLGFYCSMHSFVHIYCLNCLSYSPFVIPCQKGGEWWKGEYTTISLLNNNGVDREIQNSSPRLSPKYIYAHDHLPKNIKELKKIIKID